MPAAGKKSNTKAKPRDPSHWGVRLRSAMAEKKLSVRKAATLAGVAPSLVDSWLTGASPADLVAVQRQADALGVSFSWLLTGRQERSGRVPTVAEFFDTLPFFDGLARIRIDRLMPRDTKPTDEPPDEREG